MPTTEEEADIVLAGDDDDFPNPSVDGNLQQEETKNVKEEKPKDDGKEEKKDWMENMKSPLVVSGVVIAVIGAIFAIAKKIKEA